MENEKTETPQTEFLITLAARARSINARMTGGGDTYTMILLPGTATGVWADQIPGCEIVSDDYPRARGIRASERHGETTIKVTLPAGTIKLEIFKPASTRERS